MGKRSFACAFGLCLMSALFSQTATLPPANATTLKYFGNSAFLIIAPDGTRIVCDPYGYNYPAGLDPFPTNLVADAVTVSHSHDDHSNSQAILGNPPVYRAPGSWQVGMVRITGYEGREGSPSGPSKMRNTIFVFEFAGLKIVHYGDSGIVTDPAVLAAIRDADIVIMSIDGYVIPSSKVLAHAKDIGARTLIPVHFSVTYKELEEFLASLPAGTKVAHFDGSLTARPGMPVQVAALMPIIASPPKP